jgi:hypothetical protein
MTELKQAIQEYLATGFDPEADWRAELEADRQAYEALGPRLRGDLAGLYLGIAQGRLVCADRDWHQVAKALGDLKPSPLHQMLFPADVTPRWDDVNGFYAFKPEDRREEWEVTDLEAFAREEAQNREAWERLGQVLRREHAGKYIAMARGQVVKVTGDYWDADQALRQLVPLPQHPLVFPADTGPIFEYVGG